MQDKGGRRREKVEIEVEEEEQWRNLKEDDDEASALMRRQASSSSSSLEREPLLRNRTNNTSQIAIVGSNISQIESLDYEMIENELLKQDWRTRTREEIVQYMFMKWVLALSIGLLTGLVGFFNNLGVENLVGFKFMYVGSLMRDAKYNEAFAFYSVCNVVLAVSAAALCAYVAPAAAGSGIPEVKAYLNGVDSYSMLAPPTLFVKIVGSILGVAAGLVVGKEGPMVHTGACIASLLGQGGSKRYHLTWKWLRYFKNDRDRRDLITCGAAAGVASAFRAPVGGVLFALEEVSSWWRSALLWRTFFTTAVVAVVLRSLMAFCQHGRCGWFGEGGLIMFDVNSSAAAIGRYTNADLIILIFVGTLGGLFGSFYNYLVDKVLRTYNAINERGPALKLILVLLISLLTSCCAFGLPWFAPCTPCPPESQSKCPSTSRGSASFNCPAGTYNDLASLLLTTNDDAIRSLLTPSSQKTFHLSSLLLHFLATFSVGVSTFGIAIPSGLFIPVILAGASYGRLVGALVANISGLDQGLFALLGAASFLGGTMRTTVSLCVILLELTNDLLMLPAMMLVLLISKSVADNFNKGVYDQIVRMKGLPFMELHAEPYMRQLNASDALTGPLVSFSGVEKVGNIVHVLRSTGHNGFPVIDEPPFSDSGPEFCGLVLRAHLLILLRGKRFTKERVRGRGGTQMQALKGLTSFDFGKPGSGKGMKIQHLEVSPIEMDMYVDLHPITNTSPYIVVETMSLAKAANLFRELGLRHLCVVPKTGGWPPIIGILTRHDFMPQHILGIYPHLKT